MDNYKLIDPEVMVVGMLALTIGILIGVAIKVLMDDELGYIIEKDRDESGRTTITVMKIQKPKRI